MKPFTAHWRKSKLFFQTVKRPPAIPLAYSRQICLCSADSHGR